MALFGAILWAVYWIANERLKGGFDESVKLFSSFLFGSIYLLAGLLWIPAAFDSTSGTLAKHICRCLRDGHSFPLFSIALKTPQMWRQSTRCATSRRSFSLFFISVIVGETILTTSYVGLSLIIFGVIFNQYLACGQQETQRRRQSMTHFRIPPKKDIWTAVGFLVLTAVLARSCVWVWKQYLTTPPYVDPERYPVRGIDVSSLQRRPQSPGSTQRRH